MVNDLLPQLADTFAIDALPAPAPIAEPARVEFVPHDAARLPVALITQMVAAIDSSSAQLRAWSASLILGALARFPGDETSVQQVGSAPMVPILEVVTWARKP